MKLFRWIPLGLLALPLSASAVTYTLNSTSGGYNYQATASFTYAGSFLTVVLTNTQNSNSVAASNAQVLTGLFWNMTGAVGAGSTAAVTGGSTYSDGNGNEIGAPSETAAQHWGHRAGATSWGGGVNYGVGAAGFGHFGGGDAFQSGGSNPVLNGVDWGLLGGNWSLGGNQSPLIVSSMTFNFNVGTNFNISSLNNVWFQYGSGFNEYRGGGTEGGGGNSTPVPEPAAIAMIGFTALTAYAGRRRARIA